MSFVTGLFGPKYSPSMGQPIERAVNAAGAAKAYGRVEDALANQQNFVNALNAANGVGNLSNVYNQLQGVASGTGPNPAKAMLNEATGKNIANTGALMASARGAGANPGLIARQAAQQGAGTQQQAVGQGATLQANQALNAIGQAGNIAGQQAGLQAQATNAAAGQNISNYGQLLNAIQGYNATQAGLQQNVNNNASALQQQSNKMGGDLLGGGLNAVGGALGMAEGGEVPSAKSGPVSALGKALAPGLDDDEDQSALFQGASSFGKGLGTAIGRAFKPSQGGSQPNPAATTRGPMATMAPMAKGGKVKAIVSPGERYIPPKQAKEVASGKKKATEVGEVIKGKAPVKGDSYKNDTVKKNLSPGGVVVPRTKNMGDDVAEKATAFVRAVLAKGGHRHG